jgi:hypothetical protein
VATLAGIDGRSLNADAVGALSRGFGASRQVQQLGVVEQQQERQRAQDQAAQAKEARRRELLGLDAPQQQQAIGQPQQAQPVQLGQIPESGGLPGLGAGGFEGGQPQGIGQQPQAQAPSLAESAPVNLDQFAIEFPEEAKQIADARKAQFGNVSAREQQKISSVVIGAAQALASGDPLANLKQRKQNLPPGTPSTETDEAIAAFESGDIEGGNALLQDMVSLGNQLGILTPIKTDVLSPEALAQKQAIASAGRTSVSVGANGQPAQVVTPPELLEGLAPDVSRKVDATFRAAGGGKDGIGAIDKVMGDFDEVERRKISPKLLANSFPNASPAEQQQLQAAMDGAKTTESGLKQAAVVRAEQQRLVKASGFQDRGLELLNRIIANPNLADVLGSVEGAIDIRLDDDEAELIADIEEAGNIFTAENMSLMTGVLSESDIKILANLAGGGLNRKRSIGQFTADVTQMADKLSSKKVQTVNDAAAANKVGRFTVEAE